MWAAIRLSSIIIDVSKQRDDDVWKGIEEFSHSRIIPFFILHVGKITREVTRRWKRWEGRDHAEKPRQKEET